MDERENLVEDVTVEELKTEEISAETEKKAKQSKQKRKNNLRLKFFVAVLVVAVAAFAGATAALYKKNQVLNEDYKELVENKDSIVEKEVREKLSEVEDAKEAEVLAFFRNGLSEGSATKFLRDTYVDTHLVYQLGSKYLFRPILDVEMADYSVGEFVTDEETGLKSFYVDGERVTKHVVDVSKYQGEIDWKAVKEFGIDGAIIRAGVRGYGSGEIVADAMFDANIKGALENDLEVGVYFFSEAISVEEAEEEAQFVIDALKPYKTQLPVVIDLEEIEGDNARNEALSKEELTEVALAFLEKIEEAGYDAMLYGNITTISDMVDYTRLQDYGLWFAYYSDDIYVPYKVEMWQYSSSGKVSGIGTDCDLNIMFSEE